jgi:hypothetical protein
MAAPGIGAAIGGARILPVVHLMAARFLASITIVVVVLRKDRNSQCENCRGDCELM